MEFPQSDGHSRPRRSIRPLARLSHGYTCRAGCRRRQYFFATNKFGQLGGPQGMGVECIALCSEFHKAWQGTAGRRSRGSVVSEAGQGSRSSPFYCLAAAISTPRQKKLRRQSKRPVCSSLSLPVRRGRAGNLPCLHPFSNTTSAKMTRLLCVH